MNSTDGGIWKRKVLFAVDPAGENNSLCLYGAVLIKPSPTLHLDTHISKLNQGLTRFHDQLSPQKGGKLRRYRQKRLQHLEHKQGCDETPVRQTQRGESTFLTAVLAADRSQVWICGQPIITPQARVQVTDIL